MVRRRGRYAEDEWEAQEAEEYIPVSVPPEYRNLKWGEEKITVRELWQRYLAHELVLQPDFQRHYVWDATRASRYVESLLLGLPTPAIFLSEEHDGRWTVIDGHQRLETLFRYMQPLLEGPTRAAGRTATPYTVVSPLTLRSLEVTPELNGRGITALSVEDRGKLWDTQLSVIRLPRNVDPVMKYVLFARLNQGSMSLNNQELRNCLYRGPYNNLIARLSEEQGFLRLWGRNAPDRRMRHRELVLRFFALLHRRDRYRTPFRVFLNDEMEANRDLSAENATRYRQELEVAMRWVERIFGTEVFRIFRVGNADSPAGRWIQRRYELLYEVEMVGFAEFGEPLERIWNSANPHDQQMVRMMLRHRLVDVMTNSRFIDSLAEGTTRPVNVNTRFELWNQALSAIVRDPATATNRAHTIHQSLVRSNLCAVCPNQLTPDDAVWSSVDGQTRLVHRFCQAIGR